MATWTSPTSRSSSVFSVARRSDTRRTAQCSPGYTSRRVTGRRLHHHRRSSRAAPIASSHRASHSVSSAGLAGLYPSAGGSAVQQYDDLKTRHRRTLFPPTSDNGLILRVRCVLRGEKPAPIHNPPVRHRSHAAQPTINSESSTPSTPAMARTRWSFVRNASQRWARLEAT